jgi:hypothetical protein
LKSRYGHYLHLEFRKWFFELHHFGEDFPISIDGIADGTAISDAFEFEVGLAGEPAGAAKSTC